MTNLTKKRNSIVLKKAHEIKHNFEKLSDAMKFSYNIDAKNLQEKKEQLHFFNAKKISNNQLTFAEINQINLNISLDIR